MASCVFSTGPIAAKWSYFVGFVLSTVLMWLLRDYGHHVVGHLGPLSLCKEETSSSSAAAACMGKGAVLRISWGNCIFFALHLLALLGVSREENPRSHAHTSCLPLQFMAWAVLIGSSFAIPNHVFFVWGQIARVLAGFFLVIQMFTLLEFVYAANEWLLEKSWGAVLIGGTALMMGLGLAAIGVVYHFFAPFAWCHLNIFFITWTLVMGVAYTTISVSPLRGPNAGLLTSAAVFLYTAFLLWGALNSEPISDKCVHMGGTGSRAILIIGFFLAIASMLYSTISTSGEHGTFRLGNEAPADGDMPYRPDFFHLIFMLASAYIAMVFTAWDLGGITPGEFTLDRGWISVWVKMVSQWVVAILYTWTLVAPAVLRNRTF